MAEENTAPACNSCTGWTDWTAGMLLVRAFMGVRLVLSGLEKFRADPKAWVVNATTWYGPKGTESEKWLLGEGKMGKIGQAMFDYTPMTPAMAKPYLMLLPWAMLIAGFMILLGAFNRFAWWMAGMVWLSLAIGQMLLPDEQTIQYLTSYLLVCGIGLGFLKHNRLRITKF